jgi:hypothetical protein
MAQPTIASLFSKAAAPMPIQTPAPPKPPKPPKPPAPPKPPKHLLGARLQPVSAARLERKVEALRVKQPNAHVVVLSLCWRVRCASADQYRVMNEANHTAYDTFRKQTVVGHSEFFGMVAAGGVGTAIAEALAADERTHVLVMDATDKAEFARLAACFGSVMLRITEGRVVKVAPPANPLFAAAVAAAQGCTAVDELHEAMEAHFEANMAYEVEPVTDEDPPKAKKARKGP